MRGMAKGGTEIHFGDYGARRAGARLDHEPPDRGGACRDHAAHQRGGKVWINIFPDKSVTKKPAETRMGSGKGNPEGWVAVVKPGRVMFELAGVPEPLAREAMQRAAAQAADQDEVHQQGGGLTMPSKAAELRELPDEELFARIEGAKEELFNLRFQLATGQLDNLTPAEGGAPRRGADRHRCCASARSSCELDAIAAARRADAGARRTTVSERDRAPATAERGCRPRPAKVRTGVVVSDKMDKTVVVRIDRQVRHRCTARPCGARRSSPRTTRRTTRTWATPSA